MKADLFPIVPLVPPDARNAVGETITSREKSRLKDLCTCGAPRAVHPTSGYSEGGACLEALKVHRVMTVCEWPECEKRIRKVHLGSNLCAKHTEDERNAHISMLRLEGPQALCRPVRTIQELAEFWRTGKIPASRLTPVTWENTRMTCGDCGGPLILLNDADWSPDLPNSMSCRDQYTPWGVGICRHCTLGHKAVAR